MKIVMVGAILCLFVSSPIYAGGAIGTGQVTLIGGQVVGQESIYFGITPMPTSRASCSTNNYYQFVVDPTTASGLALYSAILAAKTKNLQVTVKGTGDCGFGQPMETVSYWFVDS